MVMDMFCWCAIGAHHAVAIATGLLVDLHSHTMCVACKKSVFKIAATEQSARQPCKEIARGLLQWTFAQSTLQHENSETCLQGLHKEAILFMKGFRLFLIWIFCLKSLRSNLKLWDVYWVYSLPSSAWHSFFMVAGAATRQHENLGWEPKFNSSILGGFVLLHWPVKSS